MVDINKLGKGCLIDIPDLRDYRYEELMGAGEPFDWGKGFNVEDIIGKLEVDHQGASLSCVGQSIKKYREALELKETGTLTKFSAKDVYQRIFNPTLGGAEIRLGMKLAVNLGVNREIDVPSYMDGGVNPTEDFMRTFKGGNPDIAMMYSAKSYASVIQRDIDNIAQVIRDNLGCVSGFNGDNEGWQTAFVKPPVAKKWGHAVYLIGAMLIDGEKFIIFINSWGSSWGGRNGYGYMKADYLSNMYSLWTLIDKNNFTTMKIIGDKRDNRQYAVGADNTLHWIFGQPNQDSATLVEMHSAGVLNKFEIEWRDNLEGLIIGSPWGVLK